MKTITISFLLIVMTSFSNAQETSYTARATDSECQAKGYDCSIKNKCVNDLSLKPFARFHPKYKKAIKAVATNPINALNWPQIFYICSRD